MTAEALTNALNAHGWLKWTCVAKDTTAGVGKAVVKIAAFRAVDPVDSMVATDVLVPLTELERYTLQDVHAVYAVAMEEITKTRQRSN